MLLVLSDVVSGFRRVLGFKACLGSRRALILGLSMSVMVQRYFGGQSLYYLGTASC